MTARQRLQEQVNAIQNAGTWLLDMDFFSELSNEQLGVHLEAGHLMVRNALKIVRYLNRLKKAETQKRIKRTSNYYDQETKERKVCRRGLQGISLPNNQIGTRM